MNDSWKQIFNDYIKSYNAINTLARNGVIDTEESLELKSILLKDIIVTMESEVTDNE